MKVICCTGDSHTWGQGASGINDSFSPELVSGDKRSVMFNAPCYVNIIRASVSSDTSEYMADNLPACHKKNGECIVIEDIPLKLKVNGKIIRIIMRSEEYQGQCSILLNGTVSTKAILPPEKREQDYSVITVHTDKTESELCIENTGNNNLLLYRIEVYRGDIAVINCGVGSATSKYYFDKLWSKYVKVCKPDVILIEAHTINDWIANITLEKYFKTLVKMIQETKNMEAVPILLGVSPILGEQKNGIGINYREYSNTSIEAAKYSNCDYIDTYTFMTEKLNGLTENKKKKLLFDDIWHVNDYGHKIYANLALKEIKRLKL